MAFFLSESAKLMAVFELSKYQSIRCHNDVLCVTTIKIGLELYNVHHSFITAYKIPK